MKINRLVSLLAVAALLVACNLPLKPTTERPPILQSPIPSPMQEKPTDTQPVPSSTPTDTQPVPSSTATLTLTITPTTQVSPDTDATATADAATQIAVLTEMSFLPPFTPTLVTPTATPTKPACSGPMASRLAVGSRARAAFTDGTDMRIRAKPGFRQTILNTVPEGTLLTVTGGPQCADDSTWWQIRTDGGLQGWMAEYQKDVYLLEPIH